MSDSKRGKSTGCSALLALLLAAFLAGCGGGAGDSANSGGSGTLGVSLTDAPACGFDAVNVTVRQVRVHQSSDASGNAGGWSEITLQPARKINLLALTNGVLEYLGETALPAGHYTQLRLVLAANDTSSPERNSVVLSSGVPAGEIALTTPSAVQTGIKLVHEFDVAAGQRVDLVLDFDACKSIVVRGNGGYLLKPVIKVVPTALNGISGYVDAALLGSNVVISAQRNGAVVRSTVPQTPSGAFLLARLEPGNYDVVITAQGRATVVIDAVPVADSASRVTISTDAAPFGLPASATRSISGTATLNPASAADEVISVAAKQTFGGGPTVTVNSQAAALLSGAYTLSVPVGAPLLGTYLVGGTLPIPLDPQVALAGQYTAEASASGYQTQSYSRDISAANAIQDFALVP
jgi:hypothetical protein